MNLRIGLIGAGVMGSDHAHTIHAVTKGATLGAVTDTDSSRAQQLGSRYGARVHPTDQSLIADPDIDAVIVASHDTAHASQVLACIDAGKPVLCEKPLAPTVSECQQIVAAQQRRGLGQLVSVGFMRRFHPGFTALKTQLSSGDFGAPLLTIGSHRNVRSYPTGGSEGTLTNSAVHDIDITEWLLDSPTTEVSWYAPRPTSLDQHRHDPQLIHLRNANGVLTSVDLFVNAQYGYDVRYEILCEQGSLRMAPTALIVSDRNLNHGIAHHTDWRSFFADAYRLELQGWVDALHGGPGSNLASAQDGLHSTQVAQALVQSMHDSRPVSVPTLGAVPPDSQPAQGARRPEAALTPAKGVR